MTYLASNPRRVLHVIEDLGLGGAERLLATMLPLLREQGVASEVIALGTHRELAEVLVDSGIPVHVCGLSSYRPSARPWKLVTERLRSGEIDLVHTHLAYANLYARAAAWASRVPATTTYHNCDYEPSARADNADFRAWKQKVFQAADWMTLRRTSRVISVSDYVKGSVVRRLGLRPEHVEVIYNGVPRTNVEIVTREARRQARSSLGLGLEAGVVVQIGRLTPQKGQLHTLRAARLLEERGRDIVWVLVGGGPAARELEEKRDAAGLTGRVRFVGSVEDVRPYLRAANVFVFPSLYEGLGIAALEAMALGLPVVAYDIGPLPEVVVHGETGVLVPAERCAKLADAVDELLQNPMRASNMGAAGRKRIESRFLIDRTAQHHGDFYRRLLSASTQVPPLTSATEREPSASS